MRLRIRWPGLTLRLRLTLLYVGMFLLAGAGLVGLVYGLARGATSMPGALQQIKVVQLRHPASSPRPQVIGRGTDAAHLNMETTVTQRLVIVPNSVAIVYRTPDTGPLIAESSLAVLVAAALVGSLGWLAAGRALAPVRAMTSAARRISEHNLNERLEPSGPEDELKELGKSFDRMLARLREAFEAQRRFVANASHELRTPLATERAVLEVALADPSPSLESLREACATALAAGAEQERLVESLLTLAVGRRGLAEVERLDLGGLASEVLARFADHPGEVAIQSELGQATVQGDPALLRRMVANLLENAVTYNEPGGWVRVGTGESQDGAYLTVTNTGPTIKDADTEQLVEPFRRGGTPRTEPGGLGLGLSIVAAVVEAHGGRLQLKPRTGGGLEVRVTLSG